jgi:hypothetical protein
MTCPRNGDHRASITAALAVGLAFVASMPAAPGQAPVVYWSAEPVLPGQTAMLQGSGWADGDVVGIQQGSDDELQIVPPAEVSINSRSVCFVVPRNLAPGVCTCSVTSSTGTLTWLLNLPQIWWFQADGGQSGTPGGWLRLFGRCLAFEGVAPSVELRRGTDRFPLEIAEPLPWTLTARLSKSLPLGDYELWAHNGTGGDTAWRQGPTLTIKQTPPPWKPDSIDLVECGAVPDDQSDDSAALARALDACKRNGGGTIYLPRGRFRLAGSFQIPAHVLLKGAGMAHTHLVWSDTDAPPAAFLTNSTGRFGIEDLSIYAHNYDRGLSVGTMPIAGNSAEAYPSDVRLRRVRFRFTPFSVKDLSEAQQAARRKKLTRAVVVTIFADDIKVIDCDFAWTTNIGFSLQGNDILCRRNVAHAEGGGWCPLGGGRRIICEDNDYSGVTTGIVRGAEVWFARNRVRHQYRGDREGFTTDGTFGGVGFLKSFEVKGDSITFKAAQDRSEPGRTPAAVRIVEGKGVGQYREIVHFGAREMKLSRPFDVPPDATSVLWAANALSRHIVYGNEFSDTSIGAQLFGGGLDCVIANNTSTRSGGFRAWGNDMCDYVQLLSNVITEGYGTAGQESFAGISSIHVVGPWVGEYKGTTLRGAVVRGNVVHSNGSIALRGSIHDVLVEGNHVMHSPTGIVGDVMQGQDGIILRGNTFKDVDKTLSPESIHTLYKILPEQKQR